MYAWLVCILLVASFVACGLSPPSTLNCSSLPSTNVSAVVIRSAGQYNVACTESSEWYVYIVGCEDSNDANSNKTVSVRLLNSPTQVIVSDNATLLPPTFALIWTSSLAGCIVSVTFTANTTVPPLLSSHVYVATASHLRSVSVLLQATLFLEGYFVTIGGNGSGTIGQALVAADPSSSVVCRRSTGAVCSVTLGISLLHLASGCPPFAAASVSLNGTNVTGALWLSQGDVFGGGFVPASTFALIAVDNTTQSLPTTSTLDVILASIQGTVIGIHGLLTASQYESQAATYVYSTFPAFNGTILVQNSTLLGSTSTPSIFQLTGVLFLALHLFGVNSTGSVIYVTPSIAEATSILISMEACFVTLASAFFMTLTYVDGAPQSFVPLYKIGISNSTMVLPYSGSVITVQSSVSTRIQILVTTSVVQFGTNAATLLQLVPTGALGSPVQPILNGSTLHFRAMQFVQQWIYFTTLAEYTVAPAISVSGVVSTTIEFQSCNFTTQQLIASHTPNPPPALLLAVSGSFNLSTLLWYDTITQVYPISTGAKVLQPPAITIGYINSSLLQFRDSTFTNLLAVGQLTQSSESTLNSNATIDIGCNTWWCQTSNMSNTLSSSCALITPQTFCNDTDIPFWITFTVLNSTCTLQTTLTASMSTPNSLTMSATMRNTRGATISMTATHRSHAAHHGLSSTLSNTNVRTLSQSDSSLYPSPTATILPITFAASPPEQPVVVQAVVVGAVAPLAGGVLSTSAAGVIQRSTVALRFSNCAWSAAPPSAAPQQTTTRGQYMTVSENPTRLAFGPDEGAMYRGGAVGNMMLLVAVCLLVVPVGLIHFHVTKAKSSIEKGNAASIGHSLGALRLPGRALVPFSVLLQPTVTAAAGLLMVSSTSSPSDIVTSVVVLCILCLIAAWPVWAVLRGCRLLVTAVDVPFVGGVKDYLAGRRVAWVPRPLLPQKSTNNNNNLGGGRTWLLDHSVSGAECFALQFDPLIGRVHSGVFRELYFLTGYVWSVATGSVAALSPDDPSSCRIAQIALIVIPAASLASLVIIRPFASPSDRNLNILLELLSLLMAIMALVDEGSSAVGLSYAMITLSLAVSLLRVIVRVQLNLLWKQKKKDTSNSNTTATTTVGSEFVSSRRSLGAPYNPINAAVTHASDMAFLNDDDFKHSAPYRPPHPSSLARRPSIARLARIQYIVGNAVGGGSDDDGTTRAKGPSSPPLSHESEAHIIQGMLDAVQRHRRLEAAIGFHKRSTSSGQEVVLFTLPPRMQQDHLIKLISIASKYSE